MAKINIDLSGLKAAGIYTIELDNTQREITNPTSLRLLPGFNNRGPFNRPVFLQYLLGNNIGNNYYGACITDW